VQKTRLISIVYMVVTTIMSGCGPESKMTLHELKENQSRAQPIIEAISRYKQEKGEFVTKLDMLTPDYLSALPQPTNAEGFLYQLEVSSPKLLG
jgi:hypothetical protein